MKFAIQVRLDHKTKPGGDTALAKSFAQRIQTAGHTAELVSNPAAFSPLRPDVVLAFNFDQPIELLQTCRAARRCGARVAVYALHHPDAGVAAYLNSTLGGVRGLIGRLVQREPAAYFHAMALLRAVRRFDLAAAATLVRGRGAVLAELAGLVDDLLVSGPSEAAEIQRDTLAFRSSKVWVVPHPIDLAILPPGLIKTAASSPSGRRFLVAGRIESRKNQQAVFAAADAFPTDEFTFAGQVNETDVAYARGFQAGLEARANCHWVGQLSMPELLQAIVDADAVLSPSWFEVMSLINLFAFALGTPVISACHTYDADLLHDGVLRYQPEAPASLMQVLQSFDRSQWPNISDDNRASRAAAFTATTWAGFDAWLAMVMAGAVPGAPV